MELTRLPRRRATDEVYDALRQAILTHTFEPGERLQIDDISRKLGVSLTPVRHAIQQLSAEGLIVIHPRSGTFVATLSRRDVEETFQIRVALECLAGELAAPRIDDEHLRVFQSLLDTLGKPICNDKDRQRHEEDNRSFHLLLLEASGNQRLVQMYNELNAHLQIARLHSRESDWAARLTQEQEEHQEIVAALKARNSKRTVAAIRAHIDRARESLMNTLAAGAGQ
jgi:DNA-binding GntR family transcriptional regulator